VRDVQYSPQLGRVASLVTSGAVHLWDPHLRLARTVRARCPPRPAGAWSPSHGAARVSAPAQRCSAQHWSNRGDAPHTAARCQCLLQLCGRCG